MEGSAVSQAAIRRGNKSLSCIKAGMEGFNATILVSQANSGRVESFPVHLWNNMLQDTQRTVVPFVLRWDCPWSDADWLGACQKMRINLRSCRLVAVIETDEAAWSRAPTRHIGSCDFMESARLPPPP